MKKYAKIINEETKEVSILLGNNISFAQSIGMCEQDIEQAYNGAWYIASFSPTAPEPNYAEKRAAEYPPFHKQFDMMYWDKINDTSNWFDLITLIKKKHPKT